MSIRFAAPRSARNPLRRIAPVRLARRPANDNANDKPADIDAQLHDALRHFARHGLAAAQEARDLAQDAAARGDEAGFDHWRSICSTLDRRMARELDRAKAASN